MRRIITPFRCVAILWADLLIRIHLYGGLLWKLSLIWSKEESR
jgi:hypothetical protein